MSKQKAKRCQRHQTLSFLLAAIVLLLLIGWIVALGVPAPAESLVSAKPTPRGLTPRDGVCDAATMQTMIDTYAEMNTPLVFTCNENIELLTGLNIKGDVTIVGQNPELRSFRVFINGNDYAERLFYVESDASLTLVSVELTRSHLYGIYATPGSQVTLDNVVFTSISEGRNIGAAIYNEGGAIVISNSFFSMSWGEVAIKNSGQLWLDDTVIWSSVGCVDNSADATAHGVSEACKAS